MLENGERLSPPTLYNDWTYEDRHVDNLEDKLWKRIVFGGVSAACSATAVAFKIVNLQGWNSNVIGGAALSFIAGAGIQNTLHYALKHKWSNNWKSFVADYSLATFLTLSQVYNNLNHPAVSPWRDPLFSIFTGLGGMCTASFIHTLFTRRLSETEEMTGLRTEEQKEPIYLPLLGLNGRASRIAWNITKLAVGVGGIFLGVYYPPALIARDYSIMVVGDAMAQLGHELWVKRLEPKNEEIIYASSKFASQPLGKEIDFYYKFMKVFLVVSHVLPGILIPAAAGIQISSLPSGWIAGLASAAYFFAGFSGGGKRHLEIIRFSNVPYQELRELKREKDPLTKAEKVFRVGKWVFATAFVGGFLVLGLTGFSFQTMNLQKIPLVDRASLIAFGIGLYGAYACSHFAKKFFDPIMQNQQLRNTAYFLTRYSPGIPWLALYIIGKMQIGDESLDNSTLLTGILATLAYGSLGMGMGLEASSRGEYPPPRIFSSTAAALILQFIVQEMTKQFPTTTTEISGNVG